MTQRDAEEIKKIIKELNVIFKERGWELLPENNTYNPDLINKLLRGKSYWTNVMSSFPEILNLHREYFDYDQFFQFETFELDYFVVEFLIPICKKYKLHKIRFMTQANHEVKDNAITIYY